MPDSVEALVERLRALSQPGVRGRLSARGLARGMIWRDGVLPRGAPDFSPALTADLLDQGYGLLALALRARSLGAEGSDVDRALVVAAESIESAVRKGPSGDVERGFHLVVAGATFHLAQYAARAYCLLPRDTANANESTAERALVSLVRSSRRELRRICLAWLGDPTNGDDAVAAKLADETTEFDLEDAEVVAITSTFVRGLALFDAALSSGDEETLGGARKSLGLAARASADRHYVSMWWATELATHLADGIWERTLHRVLPSTIAAEYRETRAWSTLRRDYISLLAERRTSEVELWPSQLDAARRAIDPYDDLVVALPTSAGKTRIAELCILRCLASGRRALYVTPLRALSAQVERGLARTFAPLGYSVTALYGASGVAVADIGTLENASIVVATPEKLDFALRQQPGVIDDVGVIVLDEGHMIGLGEREIRYEVLVQRLLRRPDSATRRLVCLSAVFAAGEAFEDVVMWVRSDAPGEPVISEWRPTRQRSATITWDAPDAMLRVAVDGETPYVPGFFRSEPPRGRRKTAFPHTSEEFILASAKAFLADGQRVLVYCPQRSSVEHFAKSYLTAVKQGYLGEYLPDQADVSRALAVGREWLGEDHVAVRCLAQGVAVHHGGLPRAFLGEIENLLSDRVLRFTIASPTLAQGIDLSCSVLVFRSIYRAGKIISPEEYANVIGRAGRAFVDLDGITAFPVFESGRDRRHRINDYRQLQANANERRLESGIVQLVEMLISVLARYGGVSFDDVAEYVTNSRGPWTVSGIRSGREVSVSSEDEFDPESFLLTALSDLDTALLSTIERVEVDVTRVADLLDAALVGSLWSRRLARRDPEIAANDRAVLLARAKWLWTNTTAPQRLGFYAAGVGHASGSYLSRQLAGLAESLQAAEAAFAVDEVEVAVTEIATLAEVVFGTSPFTPDRGLPPSWKDVLHQWFAGLDLPSALTDPSAEIEFLQDGIVFRLVWAVEAVRVQGIAESVLSAQDIPGNVALALTYGLPSMPAILLAQAGLPSRAMILRLLSRFPGTFADTEGMREWLGEHAQNTAELWATAGEELLWREFLGRWRDGSRTNWSTTTQELEARWDADSPDAGMPVRVVHDPSTGVTGVYRLDLTRLGVLATPLPQADSGSVRARVAEDPARVSISRFGPA